MSKVQHPDSTPCFSPSRGHGLNTAAERVREVAYPDLSLRAGRSNDAVGCHQSSFTSPPHPASRLRPPSPPPTHISHHHYRNLLLCLGEKAGAASVLTMRKLQRQDVKTHSGFLLKRKEKKKSKGFTAKGLGSSLKDKNQTLRLTSTDYHRNTRNKNGAGKNQAGCVAWQSVVIYFCRLCLSRSSFFFFFFPSPISPALSRPLPPCFLPAPCLYPLLVTI